MRKTGSNRGRRCAALVAVLVAVLIGTPAGAATYVPISGAGSTWSGTAIEAWASNVQQYGMSVNYQGNGSSAGRNEFKEGTVDWAASDIPYGVQDGTNFDTPPDRGFAYMPDTAGGTTFMYNLKIGPNRVTNLRLSGAVIAGIFTDTITMWNDPRIAKDNPGLSLPGIRIVPVVRSDGSGATAQFTQWMLATQPGAWQAYCARTGRNPCTQTSAYPVVPGSGMVSQAADTGVSGYVSQAAAVGSIGYVEYSYALETGFPVAKVLNAAGYYTEPTPGHVAVSLLKAVINNDKNDLKVYLTQELGGVYTNPDPRTYPLSSYSYMVLPTDLSSGMTDQKGTTIADFGKYLLCQGQNQVDALGYSALPINLVQAGFQQLKLIPNANVGTLNIESCDNPTFSTNGTNTLAVTDPFPPACDKQGPTQCATGTGGAKNTVTAEKPGTQGNSGHGTSGKSGATGRSVAGSGTTANGATATGAAGGSAACDPESGTCTGAGSADDVGDVNNQALAQPQASDPNISTGLQIALMVLAAALLVALGVAPPLIVQAVGRQRFRRGGDR